MSKEVVNCPGCAQKLRVPTDRGEVLVTCRECSLKWMFTPKVAVNEDKEDTNWKSWIGKTTRKLTGSSAVVEITKLQGGSPGGLANLTVCITAAQSAIKIKGIKVHVQCDEIISLPSAAIRSHAGPRSESDEIWTGLIKGDKFNHTETTYNSTLRLSGAFELAANESKTFKDVIAIPKSAPPSFEARCIKNQWCIRAVAETSDLVDARSEWLVLQVL